MKHLAISNILPKLLIYFHLLFVLVNCRLFDNQLKQVNPGRIRYVARVMYDGTAFRGWQDQAGSNLRTVQGLVTATLTKRFNTKVPVTGAGRTDYGVHARGQVSTLVVATTVCTIA